MARNDMNKAEKSMDSFLRRERLAEEGGAKLDDLVIYYKSINKDDETIMAHTGLSRLELSERVKKLKFRGKL